METENEKWPDIYRCVYVGDKYLTRQLDLQEVYDISR